MSKPEANNSRVVLYGCETWSLREGFG